MTLYASVLRLDRAAVKALRVTDLYSLHRVVYGLFEDVRSEAQKQASEPSGIQWVDKGVITFVARSCCFRTVVLKPVNMVKLNHALCLTIFYRTATTALPSQSLRPDEITRAVNSSR